MDSGHIALLILAGLVVLGGFTLLKLIRWMNRRYYRNMFRGNLREDYIKHNPECARLGTVFCSCGGEKVVLRNLGPIRLEGSDVIREHVCHQCGKRLFLSASGEYLEGVIRELRKEIGYEEPTQKLVASE